MTTPIVPPVVNVRPIVATTRTVGIPGGIQGKTGPPGPPGVTPNWWSGTQAEYDALGTWDPETLYIIHA